MHLSVSYVTDSYLSTPEGKQEAQRAKKEGSQLYLQAKEVVLRPGVAGGLLGAGLSIVFRVSHLLNRGHLQSTLPSSGLLDTLATRNGTSAGTIASFQP